MKSILALLLIYLMGVILAACSSAQFSTANSQPESTSTLVIPSRTVESTKTSIPPSPTVFAPTSTATSIFMPPTETKTPACLTLIYSENAQIEIKSSSGQRVLIDIFDPTKLSSPVVESDVLLTTHTHWDHWNEDFQTTFPGIQLFVETGMLQTEGVVVQGIASAHNVGDRQKSHGGTNYIYLVEINDLRIAHFGDIGQLSLTEEQMAVLGTVDIAITQINNPYSDMNAENRKGINLVEQLQPGLVIPTHLNLDTVKLATSRWEGYFLKDANVEFCKSVLGHDGIKFLVIGEAVETMLKYVELKQWGN